MDYIMTTDKLTKVYGSKAAAKDVSIHIREGEIYGRLIVCTISVGSVPLGVHCTLYIAHCTLC